ncbi:MAG: Crp/Fnr family transcriptional regulator [Thermoanaerobaculia bacterium]
MSYEPRYEASLARVPLFAAVSDDDRKLLASRCVVKHYDDGELLFSEGERCEGLFIIVGGSVRLFKTAASGREQVLTIEMAGNTLAELPVFDGGPYPASATAVGRSTLLFISKDDFRALCMEKPELALGALKGVGRRLRHLVGLIEELSFTTVRHRLGALLLREARTNGVKTERGLEFTLAFSNQELASQIGTVRELVSRNLSRLQLEKIILTEGKTIIVPDMRKLEEEVEEEG